MLLTFTAKSTANLNSLLAVPLSEMQSVDPFNRSISRLRHRPDQFEFRLATEFVPDLFEPAGRHSMSWAECCEKRALELLEMDREFYYLSYSGGIDSSVALAAILRHWPAAALARLRIYLSHESIRENPSFFRDHVSRFPLFSSFRPLSDRLISERAAVITGELGDQLFGSDVLATGAALFGDETLFADYREYAPLYMRTVSGITRHSPNENIGQELYEHFLPIMSEAPFQLRTTHDFFWWWNFTQKWQYVKFRFPGRQNWNLEAKYGEHVAHFFDSIDFQLWSLANHHRKISGGWSNYKIAAREYLYDCTGDSSQKALRKVQSLKNNYAFTSKRLALSEDFREVGLEELRSYVRRR